MHKEKPGKNRTLFWGVLILVVMILCGWLAYEQVTPLRAASRDQQDIQSEASWMQVRGHLEAIASEPHPTGSSANARVRDYIMETLRNAGYAPEIQRYSLYSHELLPTMNALFDLGFETPQELEAWMNPPQGFPIALENIVATLEPAGFDRGMHGTVLAVVHYDSVQGSPGAGDDGAALASFLEAALDMAKIPAEQRKNRVVLLITDGEEMGLLGASQFVQQHTELVHQADMVVNFEMRGNAGAPLMFETGSPNAAALALLGRAPKPIAFSLATDIYKQMPNNTDFTPFLNAGKKGLNFAGISGTRHYHQPTDDIAHLSMDTLYSYARLTRTLLGDLATTDLQTLPSGERVYFPFLPGNLVVLPLWVSNALAWAALLTCVAFAVLANRKRWMRAGRMLLALLLSVVVLGLVGGMAYGVGNVANSILAPEALLGSLGVVVLMSTLALAGALLFATTVWVLRFIRPAELCGTLSLLCAGLAAMAAALMPGAAYLFTGMAWAMLLCAAAAALRAVRWLVRPLVALLSVLVIAMLTVPLVYLVFVAMSMEMLYISIALAGIAVLAGLAAFSPLMVGGRQGGYDPSEKQEAPVA